MQNARLDETQAEIKISRRNMNNLKYADDITLWQKVKKNKRASSWKWKRRVKKLAWNSAFKKQMASYPITSWQTDAETLETVKVFFFFP